MSMSEEEVGASLAGRRVPNTAGTTGVIGGVHAGTTASARAGLKVDTQQVKSLNTELNQTLSVVTKISNVLAKMKFPGSGGGASGSNSQVGGYIKGIAVNAPGSLAPGGTASGGGSGTSGVTAALAGNGGKYDSNQMGAFGKYAAISAGGAMMGAIDNRIDRGANYALTADRYNVVMQQQYGMSQNQVMNKMRKPLANYRLGTDGINQLMGFQMQTGFQATPQLANSLAGIRAITGYSKTAGDVIGDQQAMMDPTVANRMLYMTGTNAYNFNGGLNDPMKMRQDLVRSMGLTNASILKGAKGPGSVTRARMTDAGISSQMQDEVLTYAQENLTYQSKGGKGMYNPSDKAQRKKMGIEGNFATQTEETDRLRQSREEDFSRRQLDNMASMEKMTQSMVKLLGGIEDKMSALVGARTSTRGIAKMIGSGLQIAGGIASFVAPEFGLPMMGLGTVLSGASGDPVGASGSGGNSTNTKSSSAGDGGLMVPYGYGGKKVPLGQLKSMPQFSNLNPKLQDRLLNMFRANPNVGIGGGGRTTEQQKQMFLSRYRKSSAKTDIYWNGSYWEHVSGAAAAPPGSSMHEIGLAADLVGDMDWIKKNAGKFGLRSFFDVNNEPWHVQPAELPASRSEYEKEGAPWGNGAGGAGTTDSTSPTDAVNAKLNPDARETAAGGSGSSTGFSNLRDFSGMSISQILSAMQQDSGSLLGTGGPTRGNSANAALGTGSGTGGTPSTLSSTPASGSAGAGSMAAAQAAFANGARGEALMKMIAIAGRESHWNPGAVNHNTSDRGEWQINGANHAALVKAGILKAGSTADMEQQLLDLNTNAKAMWFLSRQGTNWAPWRGSDHSSIAGPMHGKAGWDPNGSELWNTDKYIGEAKTAAMKLDSSYKGDPTGERSGKMASSGTTMVTSSPTYQITIAPQITFVGTPQSNDLQKIAQEVTSLIEQNVHTMKMRQS